MVGKSSQLLVGVLSLQGGFEAHLEVLSNFDFVNSKKVSATKDLNQVDCLIIPGGESSVFLKLMEPELRKQLIERSKTGMPIFGTCAGLIILAHRVSNPTQDSLGIIDIDVERNAYGRQLESFETDQLAWTKTKENLSGVFIRAPKITRVGPGVEVLVEYQQQPVLVKQGKNFGATFHPELNSKDHTIHRLFLEGILS